MAKTTTRKPRTKKPKPAEGVPKIVMTALNAHFNKAHDYADITVTSLTKSPKAYALQEIGYAKKTREEKIGDGVLMLLGTALHEWFEPRLRKLAFSYEKRTGSPRFLLEERFFLDVPIPSEGRTARLGGTCDLYDIKERTLYDFKIVNEFKIARPATLQESHGFQLNAYREMIKAAGLPEPEKLMVLGFARDWSDPAKGGKSQAFYPVVGCEIAIDPTVTVPLLQELARERIIAKREVMKQIPEGTKPAKAEVDTTILECPVDYRQEWGRVTNGPMKNVPRKCMYCDARGICDQLQGGLA